MPEFEPRYPPARWRLIVDTDMRTGAENMALDEAIMEAVAAGDSPPTLRFYQWAPPCLSLGKRQPLDGVDLAACSADGVDVVRRATGGWAILHTDELTYSVALRPDDPRVSGAILDTYRTLSQGLIAGLRFLGADAEMSPVIPGGAQNTSAACFEVPSAYEITLGGRKLIGSAQTCPAGRVLQHGSLPLYGDIARVARYLTFASEDERQSLATHLRERATTLSDALGHPVEFSEAAQAMARGFAAALNVDLAPDRPSANEMAAARRIHDRKVAELAEALQAS
ncbi:MAG TPA: lipoate--protein ligase family protein [Ktedonobacterales bacterium]|jgi:lipoate-protein ligase A